MKQVRFGIDHFIAEADKYKRKRLALVTNNAAVTSKGISSRVALAEAGLNLIKLFSPEHGLTARGEDGAFMRNSHDILTNLPVISLYGDYLTPDAADLEDIDTVLFDIPDAGCRFYTYLWTMSYLMEACAAAGKQFILLDKPNPIGGDLNYAEGPMLDEVNTSSFLGRWSIPIRHCCTYGELASFFAAEKIKDLQLTVFRLSNWDRNAIGSGWTFTQTSPAIKDIATALIYPGTGLLEGINVNEGRGTDTPFSICGAPWINAFKLSEAFSSAYLKGMVAFPVSYAPSDGLYAGQVCNGLKFSVTDHTIFRPVETGIHLLKTISRLYPDYIEQRLYKTRANPSGKGHLDMLLGVKDAFKKIVADDPFVVKVTDEWKGMINPYLLY